MIAIATRGTRLKGLGGLLAVWAAGVLQAQTGGNGRVSGVVVDETNKPMAYAFVSITRSPYNPKDGPASQGVTTKADGAFQFGGLIPASYSICVYTAPARGYLDTCEWNRQLNLKLAAANEVMSGIQIKLEDGAKVEFTVDDPKGLNTDPRNERNAIRKLDLGLKSAIGGHQARYWMTNRGKHVYVMSVPYNRPVALRFQVEGMDVKDDKGVRLDQGSAGGQFVVSRGEAKKVIALSLDSRP